ncbi:hypothetical protein PI125_g21121 [Phytophthora idaei]|nr:hypothetical protein PI125_g21121 [Phytophthora idaei]
MHAKGRTQYPRQQLTASIFGAATSSRDRLGGVSAGRPKRAMTKLRTRRPLPQACLNSAERSPCFWLL